MWELQGIGLSSLPPRHAGPHFLTHGQTDYVVSSPKRTRGTENIYIYGPEQTVRLSYLRTHSLNFVKCQNLLIGSA